VPAEERLNYAAVRLLYTEQAKEGSRDRMAKKAASMPMYSGPTLGHEALRGQKALRVVVDVNVPGLGQERVLERVEHKLREAGIGVSESSPGTLSVQVVQLFKQREAPDYPISLRVTFERPCTLKWVTRPGRLPVRDPGFSGSLEALDDCMDEFTNEWLRANSRK